MKRNRIVFKFEDDRGGYIRVKLLAKPMDKDDIMLEIYNATDKKERVRSHWHAMQAWEAAAIIRGLATALSIKTETKRR